MSDKLDGWFWVEWRGTLEPELFRDGRIRDLDGDWLMPAPTRKIGPRIPEPEELKATELELAKLRILVDNLDKTLAETREERDRLRAEVERMRPKEKSGWRFFNCFNPKSNFWAVREVGDGVWFDVSRRLWFNSQQTIEKRKNDGSPELTIHEAYSRLADWPEGQRQFRELTGYEPPTCKESLPVQPEERVRCYKSPNHPHSIWVYHGDGDGVYFRHNFDEFTNADLLERSKYHDARTRIPLVEALEIVRDRPKQFAKLREMAGIETPKDSVRCYRSKYGSSVLVYGVQHNTHFSPHGDWGPAQSESAAIKNKIRCTISEARAMLADLPKSLAEFDRIAGRDENRKHLARLLAIPCKEMRI